VTGPRNGPPKEVGPQDTTPGGADTTNRASHSTASQTSFWSVHEHVAPLLESVGHWPLIGSPEWCALPDEDARKRAAVCDAAQHWALRVETCQQARADASKALAGAADWSKVSREIQQRSAFREAQPWAKRVAS